MKRASLLVCALGGTMLLLVGCNALELGFDLGLGEVDAAGNVRFMDGSPDTVAVTLQGTLKARGLDATIIKGSDGTVVVESKTPGGAVLALVLKGERGAEGREQTRVALEWSGGRGDTQSSSVRILADIDGMKGTKK